LRIAKVFLEQESQVKREEYHMRAKEPRLIISH
jgi:hypothetical protein